MDLILIALRYGGFLIGCYGVLAALVGWAMLRQSATRASRREARYFICCMVSTALFGVGICGLSFPLAACAGAF